MPPKDRLSEVFQEELFYFFLFYRNYLPQQNSWRNRKIIFLVYREKKLILGADMKASVVKFSTNSR